MSTENQIVSKLAPAVFLPKRLLGQKEDVREMVLGTLYGLADDFKMGKAANGDEFRGYKGSFEFTDAVDVERPVQCSGVLYLPSGVDDMMAAAVEKAKESGGQVQIALEVSVQRTSSPAGYGWLFRQLVEPEKTDPLTELRKLAAQKASKQLTKVETPEEKAAREAGDEKTVDEAARETGDAPEPAKGGKKAA